MWVIKIRWNQRKTNRNIPVIFLSWGKMQFRVDHNLKKKNHLFIVSAQSVKWGPWIDRDSWFNGLISFIISCCLSQCSSKLLVFVQHRFYGSPVKNLVSSNTDANPYYSTPIQILFFWHNHFEQLIDSK